VVERYQRSSGHFQNITKMFKFVASAAALAVAAARPLKETESNESWKQVRD